jgi:hypothetical protein
MALEAVDDRDCSGVVACFSGRAKKRPLVLLMVCNVGLGLGTVSLTVRLFCDFLGFLGSR